MSLFTTSLRQKIIEFLPPVLRGVSFVDYLYSLMKPLQTSLNDNVTFEEEWERRAKYNGRKIILQTALNEIMSVTIAPFILVETRLTFLDIAPVIYNFTEPDLTAVIGNESENTIIIINLSEEDTNSEQLIIKIPVGLSTTTFDENVEAEVLKYKVSGVTYRVETY